jgi:hypothetical protein
VGREARKVEAPRLRPRRPQQRQLRAVEPHRAAVLVEVATPMPPSAAGAAA